MCTCSSLLIMLSQSILFILISSFLTRTKGRILCPFIETLSFDSDIQITCNNSYLIFNEINQNGRNWKFANRTSNCEQEGPQQAFVGQCGVTRINSDYLAVALKSVQNNEDACAYCRINSESMVPIIETVRTDGNPYVRYVFNITVTNLAKNQSFEILWAKRVHSVFRHSYNYYFLQECIDGRVEILVNSTHTIVFAVLDVTINRVELIIRRCNGPCRKYRTCDQEEFRKKTDENSFQIPDSIEKISCDSKCLYGIEPRSLPATTTHSRKISSTTSTTTKSSPDLNKTKEFTILLVLIGVLLCIILIIFIRYIILKLNKKKNVYTKTSNVDPDETK